MEEVYQKDYFTLNYDEILGEVTLTLNEIEAIDGNYTLKIKVAEAGKQSTSFTFVV